MAMILNPYLTFHGNAEEAMTYYGQVLGGAVEGFTLFASDTVEGMHQVTTGNNIQLSLSGDDEAALRGYWDRLADGGQVMMPLEKQMWGDLYGMVADRYGIEWHVNIAQG